MSVCVCVRVCACACVRACVHDCLWCFLLQRNACCVSSARFSRDCEGPAIIGKFRSHLQGGRTLYLHHRHFFVNGSTTKCPMKSAYYSHSFAKGIHKQCHEKRTPQTFNCKRGVRHKHFSAKGTAESGLSMAGCVTNTWSGTPQNSSPKGTPQTFLCKRYASACRFVDLGIQLSQLN